MSKLEELVWKNKFPNEEFDADNYYDWARENMNEAYDILEEVSKSEIDELKAEVEELKKTIDFKDRLYKGLNGMFQEKEAEVERLKDKRESFIEVMKAHRLNAIENQQQGIRNLYHSGVEETIDYLINQQNK